MEQKEPDKKVEEGLEEILTEAKEGSSETKISDGALRAAMNVYTVDKSKRKELLAQPSKETQRALIEDYARRIDIAEEIKDESEKAKTVLELLGTATGSAAGKV